MRGSGRCGVSCSIHLLQIMCWVAVDRGAKIARITGEDGKAAEWELAAQEIKEDILANGVDERGVLTQYYDTKALDGSLLLAPLVRFLPADHPIIKATVLAIADELTVHDLVCATRSRKPTTASPARRAALRSAHSGWSRHSARSVSTSEPESSAPSCCHSRVHSTCTARRSIRIPASTWKLPPGLHPPGVDQRRHARDQTRRAAARPRTRHLGRLDRGWTIGI